MSSLLAIVIFGLIWYGLHKALIRHKARPKYTMGVSKIYRDSAEDNTPDSRSKGIE